MVMTGGGESYDWVVVVMTGSGGAGSNEDHRNPVVKQVQLLGSSNCRSNSPVTVFGNSSSTGSNWNSYPLHPPLEAIHCHTHTHYQSCRNLSLQKSSTWCSYDRYR